MDKHVPKSLKYDLFPKIKFVDNFPTCQAWFQECWCPTVTCHLLEVLVLLSLLQSGKDETASKIQRKVICYLMQRFSSTTMITHPPDIYRAKGETKDSQTFFLKKQPKAFYQSKTSC